MEHQGLHQLVLLAGRLVLLAGLASACAATKIDQEAVVPFLERVAERPEYVGAGIVDDGTLLVVTVHGDSDWIESLARSTLPPGTRYEVRGLEHSLAELEAVAEQVAAGELSGPTRNPNVTTVGVDELRGLVVIGVKQISEEAEQELSARYGPLVVVEQHPPIVFF